jgi:alpha-galactosidase
VWSGPLSGGRAAVALVNRWTGTQSVTVHFGDIGLSPVTPYVVRDLWKQADLGTFTGSYSQSVGSHDSAFLVVSKA